MTAGGGCVGEARQGQRADRGKQSVLATVEAPAELALASRPLGESKGQPTRRLGRGEASRMRAVWLISTQLEMSTSFPPHGQQSRSRHLALHSTGRTQHAHKNTKCTQDKRARVCSPAFVEGGTQTWPSASGS